VILKDHHLKHRSIGECLKIADDRKNDEIFFLNCDFQQFSSLIPDLTALSPAENLHENMKKLFGDRDA
jgi:hypothetical protein